MKKCLFILIFAISTNAFSFGAWLWDTRKIEELSKKSSFKFLLPRMIRFKKNGDVDVYHKEQWKHACMGNNDSAAWILVRFKVGTKLTPANAKNIINRIAPEIEDSCFKRVSINIEPVLEVEEWFFEYIETLRKNLDSKFKLDITTEATSDSMLPNWNHWHLEDHRKVLRLVDGIEIMNYDHSIKSKDEYLKQLSFSLDNALELTKKFPDKLIRFGLPTYYDVTQYHDSEIEGAKVFVPFFQGLPKNYWKTLCAKNFQLTFFEAGEISKDDLKRIENLKAFFLSRCSTL